MRPTRALVAFVSLWALGCAGSGGARTLGPGDRGYLHNVSGEYSGRLMIAERPFEARLQLRTARGGRVQGSLRVLSPVAIDGSVGGRVIDDLVRITVTYTGPNGCDGQVEGILTVAPGGARIEGPVTISDCAEPVAAHLSVRRSRDGDGPS